MEDIFFYLFSIALIVSSLMAISMAHPVHSVLSLIGAFISAASLFFMIGAEFLGASIVIVYVGAVAVLFLFVVMMLDNDKLLVSKNRKLNKLGFISTAMAAFISYYYISVFNNPASSLPNVTQITPNEDHNTLAIGKILYTNYLIPFQISGLLLLVAMIGSIILTLNNKKSVKRQDISKQIQQPITIKLVNAPFGKGVKL